MFTIQSLIQSLIARALDNDCYVAMASIDLSAAFDMVDTKLLIKRLRVIGHPNDLISLIETWIISFFYHNFLSPLKAVKYKNNYLTFCLTLKNTTIKNKGTTLHPYFFAMSFIAC